MFSFTRMLVSFSCLIWLAGNVLLVSAQMPNGWAAHDLKRPAPPVVKPGKSNLPLDAPGDAIVLFDGSDLSQWRSEDGGEANWKLVDGAMQSVAGSGSLFTREEFGDCQLHLEWAAPVEVKRNGQGRGNSGVFFMGAFEVQVLDSFNNPTYADGSAAAVYGQHPPLVNACREPGQWQSYDIVFNGPEFDGGKLISPARVTVLHNGVLVQNHSEYYGPSQWLQHATYQPRPEKQSLALQDHGSPVQFRNIWIRHLVERPAAEQRKLGMDADFQLDDETAQKLVGAYRSRRLDKKSGDKKSGDKKGGDKKGGDDDDQPKEVARIRMDDGKLWLKYLHTEFGLVPVAEGELAFQRSAGSVRYSLSDEGELEAINVFFDARGKDAVLLPVK